MDNAINTLNQVTIPQNAQDIATAQQALDNAAIAYTNAKKTYAATMAQIEQDTRLSQVTFDNAQTALAQAINAFTATTASTQQDLNVAQAQLQTAQLTLTNAQTALTNLPTGTTAIAVQNAQRSLDDAKTNYAIVDQRRRSPCRTRRPRWPRPSPTTTAKNKVDACGGNFSLSGCKDARE